MIPEIRTTTFRRLDWTGANTPNQRAGTSVARTGTASVRTGTVGVVTGIVRLQKKSREVAEKQGEYTEKYTEKQTENPSEYTEKVTEKPDEVTEKLSETDERIIALIHSNPHITQKMLSEAIGVTRPYIGRKLLELQARNIIRRVGPNKGGCWEVLPR